MTTVENSEIINIEDSFDDNLKELIDYIDNSEFSTSDLIFDDEFSNLKEIDLSPQLKVQNIILQMAPLMKYCVATVNGYIFDKKEPDFGELEDVICKIRDLFQKRKLPLFIFCTDIFCPYITLRDMFLFNSPGTIQLQQTVFQWITCRLPQNQFCFTGEVIYPADPISQGRVYTANAFLSLAFLSADSYSCDYALLKSRGVLGEVVYKELFQFMQNSFFKEKKKRRGGGI